MKVLSGRVRKMDKSSLIKNTLIYLGLPPRGGAAIAFLEPIVTKCLQSGDLVEADGLISLKPTPT
jgi:hypothetical protein